MSDRIRWGILSTAAIGPRALIPAINNAHNSELVAVASRNQERGQAFADEHGIPTAYGSYEELVNDPNIDAIYNPLPNDLHAPWSIQAAQAGKHVLCEKPMAMDASEAQKMVDEIATTGKLLAEAFMYRFHPRTHRLKEMVAEGAVGTLRVINTSFSFPMSADDTRNIRLFKAQGGGAIMDIGCYCVSIMRLVTGAEPTVLDCKAYFNDDDVDEQAVATLEFPDNVLAHFDCNFRAAFANFADVRGTTGRILVENSFLPGTGDVVLHYWNDGKYEEIKFDGADQYQLMVEDFADAIINDRQPRYTGEQGVLGMKVMDALRTAAAQRG